MTTFEARAPEAPAHVTFTDVESVPSLGGLYAQALGRSAQAMFTRGPVTAELPSVGYRAEQGAWDSGHLAAYQRLVGEPGTDDVPPGYLHVLAFGLAMKVMTRADFPLPVLGMVHVANRVEQARTVRFGEPLVLQAWPEALWPHRRGAQVDLVARVTASGEPVWQGRSTYLAKGVQVEWPSGASADALPVDRTDRAEVPEVAPHALWSLNPAATREYADVSGDRNPIHLSVLAAKAFGFPRTIAHGMDTAARSLAAVRAGRGSDLTWTVEFAAPVTVPGRVAFSSWAEDAGVESFAVRRRRDGKLHLHGSVTSYRD